MGSTTSPKPTSPKAASPPGTAATSPPAAGPGAPPASAPLTSEAAQSLGILPASHWHHEGDDDAGADTDDTASTIGSITSTTASLSESIYEYRKILGRTYHSDNVGNAEGWQPNDERHGEALELFHHVNTMLLKGKLYLAPLSKDIHKALDIATGTGLWAIDFADQFPDCEVVGTDVSPNQPTWVPPNVKFEIDDCNTEWTWPDSSIDYVHARSLIGVVDDWEKFYRQAFRVLKPGGYVEDLAVSIVLSSDDGTVTDNCAVAQWGKVFTEGGKRMGRTFRIVEDDVQKTCMEKAGFVDVVVKDIRVPLGSWPQDKEQKELGMWTRIAIEADVEGYVNYIWGYVLGWAPEDIAKYCAAFRRELKDTDQHTAYTTRIVYGRKPE